MFLDLQLAALNKAKPLFTNMKYLCPGENAKWAMKPFQHGFMLTINATIFMQWDLARPTNPTRIPPRPIIPQILTGPLSQDELERNFGQVREVGGGHNAHPSSLEYLQRLAQLIKIMLLENQAFNVISRKKQIMELQESAKEPDACFSLENGQTDIDINEVDEGGLDGIRSSVISKFNDIHDFGVDFKVDLQKMFAFFNQFHPKDGMQSGGNLISGMEVNES